MNHFDYDVFISYSRKDYIDENNVVIPGNPVSAIKELLKANGISFWFDEEGIYHGDTFAEKIATNIEKSMIMLFLSSESSNASKWTSKEIAAATEWKKKIIPVRLDRSTYNRSVMLYISDLDFVEYYKDANSAKKTIIESINNYKKECEKARALEKQRREREEQEKLDRERAEKRRREQQGLVKEQENSIRIIRLSEEALEKQRAELHKQISSLDDKAERERLLLLLEQSNQAAFDERAKTRLLLKNIDDLNSSFSDRVKEEISKGGYISQAAAEEQCQTLVAACKEEQRNKLEALALKYQQTIDELSSKCKILGAKANKRIDHSVDEINKKHKEETNNLLLRLNAEEAKSQSLAQALQNKEHELKDTERIKRNVSILSIVLGVISFILLISLCCSVNKHSYYYEDPVDLDTTVLSVPYELEYADTVVDEDVLDYDEVEVNDRTVW